MPLDHKTLTSPLPDDETCQLQYDAVCRILNDHGLRRSIAALGAVAYYEGAQKYRTLSDVPRLDADIVAFAKSLAPPLRDAIANADEHSWDFEPGDCDPYTDIRAAVDSIGLRRTLVLIGSAIYVDSLQMCESMTEIPDLERDVVGLANKYATYAERGLDANGKDWLDDLLESTVEESLAPAVT